MDRKIVYVDMDGVMCDFAESYHRIRQENPQENYPQSKQGFFLNLIPIKKSIEVVNTLRALDVFDVYILTSPSVRNPYCYLEKRLWIEQQFDFEMAKKLIISPNKGLNKGDYLIDDNINGKGQDHFEGKLIHFGSEEFKDWSLIWEFFQTKYNLKETLHAYNQ